ncbi:hypothetical protein GCM10028820_12290 [Tessaracoccus terricola]
MSTHTGSPTDVDAYVPDDTPPSEAESAFITIAMFGGLVVFAVGCFLLIGW